MSRKELIEKLQIRSMDYSTDGIFEVMPLPEHKEFTIDPEDLIDYVGTALVSRNGGLTGVAVTIRDGKNTIYFQREDELMNLDVDDSVLVESLHGALTTLNLDEVLLLESVEGGYKVIQ